MNQYNYRNTLCHILPHKADFLAFFSMGEHNNGQQFEQLIFIEITLYYIEFF